MKKANLPRIIVTAAILCAMIVPSSVSADSGETDRAAVPLGLSVNLFTTQESISYNASLFGIPFSGTLSPGEPLVVDIPFIIHFETEILDIGFWEFTVRYHLTFRGELIVEDSAHFAHGDYVLHYNQVQFTPMIWDMDFNLFGMNWPGFAQLWALCLVPDALGFQKPSAKRWLGDRDISFAFPDFMTVDAYVSAFGVSSNTFAYHIYDPWSNVVGEQAIPFGFYTYAYNVPEWW